MEEMHSCEYCGEQFSSLSELNIHKGKAHASREAEKLRFPCTRCGEVLSSPPEKAKHMKSVHPEAVRWINLLWWALTIAAIILVLWQYLN